jgi:hypothetical protein
MQPQIPLSLALTDLIPNLFFLIGVGLLYRRCYPSRLFALGAGLVFVNAMGKAAWKIILAFDGPNVAWLSEYYLVLLSLGFLAMFAAVLLQSRRSGAGSQPLVLALAPWKVPFLVLAVIASVGAYLLWIRSAWRQRIWTAAAGFAISLIITLVMSAITGDDTDITRQWTAQLLNTINQGCFALAAYYLSRPAARQ